MTGEGPIVVRGAGDLGSAVVHRLFRVGYRVVALERRDPLVVRRTVSFAQAILDGTVVVEGIEGRAASLENVESIAEGADWPSWVPVVVDPDGEAIAALRPVAVIDARLAKTNLGTGREDARVTIGLGPGFTAGEDVDYVVETLRGHELGRLLTKGAAAPNTGVPGIVGGVGEGRVIRSPASGAFTSVLKIGQLVEKGDVVGAVAGAEARANVGGLLRGLVADGTKMKAGQKLGDVDPRGAEIDHTLISDKARAVAGAVLEGLLLGGVLPDRGAARGGGDV